jgi:hypothetical protein
MFILSISDLRRLDISTRLNADQFGQSSNITMVTITTSETAVLVLVMGRIYLFFVSISFYFQAVQIHSANGVKLLEA